MANMSGENDYKITWLKPKYQLHSSNNIKPLMSNTELLNMIELTNIKKEYVMGCNMEIDGSKYPIHKSSYLDFLQNLATKCPKIEKLERNDDEIKPSSEGQITYIENILRDLQLDLSEEFKNYKEDNRIAKAFLDRYIKEHEFFKKNNKKASSSNNNEIRPATPKQINFAEILAKKHNVKLPKDYKSNIKVCGDFINEYSKK